HARTRGRDERAVVPRAFPRGDLHLAAAVRQVAAPAPGATADGAAGHDCGRRLPRRGFRERLAVQPRVQAPVRPDPGAGSAAHAPEFCPPATGSREQVRVLALTGPVDTAAWPTPLPSRA